jgi:hypothetical protein
VWLLYRPHSGNPLSSVSFQGSLEVGTGIKISFSSFPIRKRVVARSRVGIVAESFFARPYGRSFITPVGRSVLSAAAFRILSNTRSLMVFFFPLTGFSFSHRIDKSESNKTWNDHRCRSGCNSHTKTHSMSCFTHQKDKDRDWLLEPCTWHYSLIDWNWNRQKYLRFCQFVYGFCMVRDREDYDTVGTMVVIGFSSFKTHVWFTLSVA